MMNIESILAAMPFLLVVTFCKSAFHRYRLLVLSRSLAAADEETAAAPEAAVAAADTVESPKDPGPKTPIKQNRHAGYNAFVFG